MLLDQVELLIQVEAVELVMQTVLLLDQVVQGAELEQVQEQQEQKVVEQLVKEIMVVTCQVLLVE